SHKSIFRPSISERKRNVEHAGAITARMRGSVRNGRYLLSTGDMASSRKELVHVLNVLRNKWRTAGFFTLRRMTARYAGLVRNGGRFHSEVGEGCSMRA